VAFGGGGRPSDTMTTITKTTRLTGARGFLAALAILGLGFGWRAIRSASFDTAGRAAIQSYLVAEAQRTVLDSAGSTLAKVTEGDLGAGLVAGQAILRAQHLTVRSIGIHGFGDTLHARVKYGVGGEDAEHVSYLRLTHSIVGGWQVVGRSSAFAYYTRL
jgi:hypothetical protein